MNIQPTTTLPAAIAAPSAPFVVEFFTVQGLGFRCVAYCDDDAKWRDAVSHEELFGDIYILE